MVAFTQRIRIDGHGSNSPQVSVILPTHNRPLLLAEALDSLEAQTFSDWEAIVVNDASNPAIDIGRIVSVHPRVTALAHQSRHGGAAAKNTGVDAAQGELLAFLDDDDMYDPDYLGRSVEVLARYPDIEVLFMGVRWFGKYAQRSKFAHGESLRQTLQHAPGEFVEAHLTRWNSTSLLDALLLRVPMPFQRAVVRRAAFDKVGAYRVDCLLWDCEWALRASMFARCGLLNEPLYLQRSNGQGLFSQADRQLDQIESAAEMVRHLYEHSADMLHRDQIKLLRRAASRNTQQLAYFLSTHGDVTGALQAWWCAQRLEPSLSTFGFLLRALLRSSSKTSLASDRET